jgi:quaternary ammonium compound-resistance protein SugE
MAWIMLMTAGIFECIWAVELKYKQGFTKIIPSIIFLVAMLASMALLSLSMKSIPIGTAYAVWTGIGAACVATIGMIFMGDTVSFARIICIFLIVSGVVGLKVFSHA